MCTNERFVNVNVDKLLSPVKDPFIILLTNPLLIVRYFNSVYLSNELGKRDDRFNPSKVRSVMLIHRFFGMYGMWQNITSLTSGYGQYQERVPRRVGWTFCRILFCKVQWNECNYVVVCHWSLMTSCLHLIG